MTKLAASKEGPNSNSLFKMMIAVAQLVAVDFLPISRGQISAPFLNENSFLFPNSIVRSINNLIFLFCR